MSSSSIVCLGSIMCDLMSYVPRMPKAGESLMGCRIVPGNGGKGANPAVAAARLGASVTLIGKIGSDQMASGILDNCRQNHIKTDYVYKTSDATTGAAIIIVEQNGENRIIVAAGANLLLTPDEVVKAENEIRNCRVFACNFETNLDASKAGLKIANESGVTSIVNAAPAVHNPDPEFYTLSTIFCVNETEAEITTGMSDKDSTYEEMAAELLKRGCENVIITMGSKGVLLASQTNPTGELIQSPKVKAIDTTGAGDAFVGSLAYYLAEHPKLSLPEKVRRACVYASYSVQKPGTQSSFPKRSELPANLFG